MNLLSEMFGREYDKKKMELSSKLSSCWTTWLLFTNRTNYGGRGGVGCFMCDNVVMC